MPRSIKCGVAGFPPNFFRSSLGKKRENIFEWLRNLGLHWIEHQCTYGVKMKEAQALKYKELSKKWHIGSSIHAPYYISLASRDNQVVLRSKKRLFKSFELAVLLNSQRIIFHPGHWPGYSESERAEGLDRIIKNLISIENDLPIDKVKLYPEIGGKIKQLGSIDDIIRICEKVTFARPCLDLAHLHARELGSLNSQDKIESVFDKIEKYLGKDYLKSCHIHMYPVSFNNHGELSHKAFGDKPKINQAFLFDYMNPPEKYYPDPYDFVRAIHSKGMFPVIISEAKNTQEKGAILLRDIYEREYGERIQ